MTELVVGDSLIGESTWGAIAVDNIEIGTITMRRSRPSSTVSRMEVEIRGGPFFLVSGALEDDFRFHFRGMGIKATRVGYNRLTDTATWLIHPWEASP